MTGFDGIAGNRRLINSLREAVKSGRISHAYIFDGERGSGKRTFANAFARAIQCLSPIDGDSCGVCRSCRMMAAGSNPDVFYVRPDKRKSIGVDDVRDRVIKVVETKPYMFSHKVFIIEGGEAAITGQAQNALLKTLEEPVPYAVFVIITESAGSLLPTVQSRAVTIKLKPVDTDTIVGVLATRVEIDNEKARFVAAMARGNIGRAIEIAGDEGFARMRGEVTALLAELSNKDLVDVLFGAKVFDKYKDSADAALDIAALFYRDVAVFIGGGENNVLQRDILNAIKRGAAGMAAEDALRGVNAALAAKSRLSSNAGLTLTAEIMLLQMAGKLKH